MCGLIHVKRFDGKSAVKMTERRYRDQKERGKEGFGFVSFKGEVKLKHLRAAEEDPILVALRQQDADEVLFHHRNPSSTMNIWEQAHPIKVSMGKHDYYVAHNGVIHNAAEIKKEHDEEKIPYSTLLREYWLSTEGNVRSGDVKFNDSEAFAIEFAKSMEKENHTDIDKPRGSIAFIAVKVERETGKAITLYWGRNLSNPLKVLKHEDFLVITSVGKGPEIDAHHLFSYDYEKKEYGDEMLQIGVSYTPPKTTDYSNWERNRDDADDNRYGFMGFGKPDNTTVQLIGSPDDKEKYALEKWLDDQMELDRINESLTKTTDKTMREYLETDKKELEAAITEFNEKYPKLASK